MKRFLILVGGITLLLGMVSMAGAATYTLQPIPADLFDLDHNYYYTWGINQNFVGEQITSVSLSFMNIHNWDENPNELFINLLDNPRVGVWEWKDISTPGNALSGQGIELSVSPLEFPYFPPQNFTFDLTPYEISVFKTYSADGLFGFGFDPDCHYYNDGITLTINTTPVPEPGTMLLFGTGLMGLAGWGRKKFRK